MLKSFVTSQTSKSFLLFCFLILKATFCISKFIVKANNAKQLTTKIKIAKFIVARFRIAKFVIVKFVVTKYIAQKFSTIIAYYRLIVENRSLCKFDS